MACMEFEMGKVSCFLVNLKVKERRKRRGRLDSRTFLNLSDLVNIYAHVPSFQFGNAK